MEEDSLVQGKLPLGVALEAPSQDMGGDLRPPPLQVTGRHKPVGPVVARPDKDDYSSPCCAAQQGSSAAGHGKSRPLHQVI